MNGRMDGYEEREGGSKRKKKKENFITNSYILL
jgi:hypothetical protein